MPESIREKSSRVKSAGGIESLSEMIAELPNLYQRNKEILDEVGNIFLNLNRVIIFILDDACTDRRETVGRTVASTIQRKMDSNGVE
jgi:hypothetical protein